MRDFWIGVGFVLLAVVSIVVCYWASATL